MAARAGEERVLTRAATAAFFGAAVLTTGCTGCTKDRPRAAPVERALRTQSAEIRDPPRRVSAACGPRGLPPDRHFVAEGHCARVVALDQGPLRGILFAPTGDLLGVTREGEIRRYRDVDGDGRFGEGAPETVVWARTGGDNAHDCRLEDHSLYCGSKLGVKRWRYAAEIDAGGIGEDVVVGMPEGGRHASHPIGIWDGELYVVSGSAGRTMRRLPFDVATESSVVKRFPLASYVPGKPFPWSGGELVVRGARNITALARHPGGRIVGIDGALDDVARGGADLPADNPGEAVITIDRPITIVQAHSSALGLTFVPEGARFALAERWRGGAFAALHGSSDRARSTGHRVIWIPFDAGGTAPMPTSTADATTSPYEVVFGGGRYGSPRDGAWSWKMGDAEEDPVMPVSVALSPVDGALYVSSEGPGGPGTKGGAIYRVALLGE